MVDGINVIRIPILVFFQWYDKLPKINKSGAILMGVVLTILLLTVVMLAYFIHKCNHLRRMKVSYRYSMINQTEEDEVEAALLNNSLYDDSDEEVSKG